jgi:hypothetical protein
MGSPFTLDLYDYSTTAMAWMGHYANIAGASSTPYCTGTGGTVYNAILQAFQPKVGRTAQASPPAFSVASGSYQSTQTVSLTAATGGVICYNLSTTVPQTNGSTGCTNGTLYAGSLTVSSTETISAVAGGTGYTDSPLVRGAYTISPLIAHVAMSGGPGITTPAINTTGATLLVACIQGYPGDYTTGSGTTGPITDSNGNTWNYLTNHQSASGFIKGQIAYAYNPTVGSGHTFTFTFGSHTDAIDILAFANTLTTSAVFDQQNGAASNSSASLSTGNITPSQANEIIVSCHNMRGNTSPQGRAVSGSFAIVDALQATAAYAAIASAYYVDPATAAIAITWSQTAASEEAVSIASFEHP